MTARPSKVANEWRRWCRTIVGFPVAARSAKVAADATFDTEVMWESLESDSNKYWGCRGEAFARFSAVFSVSCTVSTARAVAMTRRLPCVFRSEIPERVRER